jgi:hypothetical protein
MTEAATCKIACSACNLEAQVAFPEDQPYTVTFDSVQFTQSCRSASAARKAAFSCVDLDLAIAVVTTPFSSNRRR